MSLFRRMFSADYRAAVAAEAAGNVDVAAQRYALAGELEGAVRMHIARAARAPTRQGEIAALRDAVHWAGEDPTLKPLAARSLGRALLETARLEGIATERDRTRVREAADLLVAGGDHRNAGEALELIQDLPGAARAYSAGGIIDKLEDALTKDATEAQRQREEAEAFKNYEVAMSIGRRDDARAALVRAAASAPNAGEYRRRIDQLDAAILTGNRVEIGRRGKSGIVVCSAQKIVLGRDALADLPLRAGCVSRHHAEIEQSSVPPQPITPNSPEGPASDPPLREQVEHADSAFWLRDLQSRNGTTLGGMPLVGRVPLIGTGRFSLGEECAIDFEVANGVLVLTVATGVDRGLCLLLGPEDHRLDLKAVGLALDMMFRNGRPLLGRGACHDVTFNGEVLGEVRVQLIRGDQVIADGDEIRVA